jgi:iron complex outermembrane receptor protein
MFETQRAICHPRSGSRVPKSAIVLTVALLHGAASVPAAHAQEPPADTIPLAPVDVSVLRTLFRNDNAPFSVAVLTEEDLHRGRSDVFIEELLQRMPGVQVQNRFNPAVGERIMIRGFGARAQFGLRGFRVVVDGIPATLPDGQGTLDHLDIGSVGRVEVMRGPSSALFGNAGGGVINFTSRAPAPGPAHVEVDAVGGSDGLWRGQATVSGTAGTLGYLLSAYGVTYDGFRVVPDSSSFADDFSSYGAFERLGLNARVNRPTAGGELSLTVNVLDLGAENPGSRRAQDTDPWGTIANTYLNFQTRKDISQQQAGLRWAGPLGASGFQGDFSIYGVHRTTFNPIPADLVDLERNGGGIRAMVSREYDTEAGVLGWHAGADLDLQSDDRKEFENSGGEAGDPLLDQKETVLGTGVFLQANLELDGGTVILAGLRYDRHRFEAEDHFPVEAGNPDDSGTLTMSQVSPSAGIDLPVADRVNLFGSYSTVFETPTTSELSNEVAASGGFNPNLEPMTGHAFEAGIRGGVGANASFELAAYQTNLENELIGFEIEGREGVLFFRNAGESRHRGVEGTLSLADNSGLVRGDVTYTYTDAKFQEYEIEVNGAPVDASGNRVPGVAPRRIQALLRLTPDLGIGDPFAEIVATHMDDVPVNDVNSAFAPSYELVDVRVGLGDVAVAGMTFAPWVAVTNALDEEYIGSVAVNAFGNRFFEPGPGRSFQVGFRAGWGGGN